MKLSRNEFEDLLLKKLYEIKELYQEYAPGKDYLSMTIINGAIMANNGYMDEDADLPVDFYARPVPAVRWKLGQAGHADRECRYVDMEEDNV